MNVDLLATPWHDTTISAELSNSEHLCDRGCNGRFKPSPPCGRNPVLRHCSVLTENEGTGFAVLLSSCRLSRSLLTCWSAKKTTTKQNKFGPTLGSPPPPPRNFIRAVLFCRHGQTARAQPEGEAWPRQHSGAELGKAGPRLQRDDPRKMQLLSNPAARYYRVYE